MINEVLTLVKDNLNLYFERKLFNGQGTGEKKVVFIDGDKTDPIAFRNNAVTPILINVEEESILRQPDRYLETTPQGKKKRVNPVIRLNLYILFVSRFSSYEEALKYLSMVIKYFQSNQVFTHQNTPTLSEGIDKLVMELMTLPFSEQNEVWNALRTAYLPSVLYKAKMIVFSDDEAIDSGVEIIQVSPSIQDQS